MKRTSLKTKHLVLCALFAALTAAGAFIQIPVPGMDYFTLQFLFVLMAGMLLGSTKGAISVGVYVLLGLAGIPIFAAGGGITYIFRPSFGYLIGFIAGAFVTGKIKELCKKNKFRNYLLSAFGGFFITYAIGLAYKYLMLNYYVGQKTAAFAVIAECFPLDMPGDICLCVIASLLAIRLVPAFQSLEE